MTTATGTNDRRNQIASVRAEMLSVDIFCNSPQMPHNTIGTSAYNSHDENASLRPAR